MINRMRYAYIIIEKSGRPKLTQLPLLTQLGLHSITPVFVD